MPHSIPCAYSDWRRTLEATFACQSRRANPDVRDGPTLGGTPFGSVATMAFPIGGGGASGGAQHQGNTALQMVLNTGWRTSLSRWREDSTPEAEGIKAKPEESAEASGKKGKKKGKKGKRVAPAPSTAPIDVLTLSLLCLDYGSLPWLSLLLQSSSYRHYRADRRAGLLRRDGSLVAGAVCC